MTFYELPRSRNNWSLILDAKTFKYGRRPKLETKGILLRKNSFYWIFFFRTRASIDGNRPRQVSSKNLPTLYFRFVHFTLPRESIRLWHRIHLLISLSTCGSVRSPIFSPPFEVQEWKIPWSHGSKKLNLLLIRLYKTAGAGLDSYSQGCEDLLNILT